MGDNDTSDRTLWCGNLPDKVTEELLYELFLQAGPVEKIVIPKDKDGRMRRFAFIEFRHSESVPYTRELMNGIRLYGNSLQLKARSGSSHDTPSPMSGQFHRSMSEPDMVRNGPNTPYNDRHSNERDREGGRLRSGHTPSYASPDLMPRSRKSVHDRLGRADTFPAESGQANMMMLQNLQMPYAQPPSVMFNQQQQFLMQNAANWATQNKQQPWQQRGYRR